MSYSFILLFASRLANDIINSFAATASSPRQVSEKQWLELLCRAAYDSQYTPAFVSMSTIATPCPLQNISRGE